MVSMRKGGNYVAMDKIIILCESETEALSVIDILDYEGYCWGGTRCRMHTFTPYMYPCALHVDCDSMLVLWQHSSLDTLEYITASQFMEEHIVDDIQITPLCDCTELFK